MTKQPKTTEIIAPLSAAGLDPTAAAEWLTARPRSPADFAEDCRIFAEFWRQSANLLARLPNKAQRNSAEQIATDLIERHAREARRSFATAHVGALYDRLTDHRSRFLRIDELLAAAALAAPGLVPSADDLDADRDRPLRDKSGVEIDQGLFLSAVLASERHGRHLCHAMLLPREDAVALAPRLARDGIVDLGGASVRRQGRASIVTMQNPRHLNAEDETTLPAMATCVDLALLDELSSVAVVRGGPIERPHHGGRVFGAGINLTHLYQGRIPYLWYLERDLGYVHKIYRGLAHAETLPDDVSGETIEKPWIAAVEGFAIGGHCQLLLASDYVIAERTAYLALPARKEGIIPGMANLRLPRFVGDRIARQAIQYERRIDCAQPDGRLICDEIVEGATMDAAVDRVVHGLSSSGVISAAANRRALRVAQEPLDLFRAYAAVYAREQAFCHFSPALIANLERYWIGRNRAV
jgi:thioesterase DpgC